MPDRKYFLGDGSEPQWTYESRDREHKSLLYVIYMKLLDNKVKDFWVEKQAKLDTDHKILLMEIEAEVPVERIAKQCKNINLESWKIWK